MIAILLSHQLWIPADGCVLVDLPDGYAGIDPLADGTLLARFQQVADPDSGAGDLVTTLDDGETFSALPGSASSRVDASSETAVPREVIRLTEVEHYAHRSDSPRRIVGLSMDARPRRGIRPRIRLSPEETLPYRTVHDRSPVYEYDRRDESVRFCERCGEGGMLKRDYDDVALPALCAECFVEQTDDSSMCCEDWCAIDLDHTGLCQWW